MPVKAGRIEIELRASAQKLRSDMDAATKEIKRIGTAGTDAGKELAKGMETGAHAVQTVTKVTTETIVALVGTQRLATAELVKYTAAASSGGGAAEGLANTYRALRLALSPTPFTVATVAVGILAEQTVRLVNARAKLIEQQSLIAATSGMSINAVQRIDTVTAISGGNAGSVRNLSRALSGRIDNNQNAVRSSLDTLGISSAEGRQGEPLDPALLEHIAAAFASIEDPAKRATAAVNLFGANQAAEALKELSLAFLEASQAADKYGITLDQVSRNQIYQARQDFAKLKDALTDFSDEKTWAESFKTSTEIVAAALYDMSKRGTSYIGELMDAYTPGLRLFLGLTNAHDGGPKTISDAELQSGDRRKSDILTGLAADGMFAHEQTLSHANDNTLAGQQAQQASAQARADLSFQTLSVDAAKRSVNPNDPTLLSNAQRFGMAVQQQSAAALATAIGEKVAAMEAAAAAQKLAQAAAERLAEFRGKAGDRLQALSDQVTGRALADDPASAARFAAGLEVNRDSDRTMPAERAARAQILSADVDRVQAAEDAKRDTEANAALQKDLNEQFAAMGNPLAGLAPSREGSRDRVRLDDEAEARQRDTGDRAGRLATLQSQPGDETALAQRVLDIRLNTVAAERAILAAHSSQYTLEDLTLAQEKLSTEELNAHLNYDDQIAEIEKGREQAALSTGGAYQQQLRAITQQLDALNQVKVTSQNITDIELARIALAQKAAELQVQQLLALGSLKDGWNAFWIEQQEQAEKTGKVLFDGMNDAMNKISADLTKLATGEHKKTTFGKDLESVGRSMTQASIKSAMQSSLGAAGKALGIHPAAGKPDGTAANPYHVVTDGQGQLTNPLAGMVPSLPPAFGGSGAAAAAGAVSGGLLGWLGRLFGGGSGGGTAVDSSITFMAGGGDADPGRVYGVAEAGEAELISPKNSSRITPVSKLGGSHTYHIDARGADLGAENRVARAIEAAHNSAVQNSVRANSERAKRVPKRSS